MPTLDTEAIINTIATAPKTTPVKVYLNGELSGLQFPEAVHAFLTATSGVVVGDWRLIEPVLSANAAAISDQYVEVAGQNTGVPLADFREYDARIEPGAIIRSQVAIGHAAVIMMGAIINIGAEIGEGSMIDMGAILGGRAQVGKYCHIGAGTVLAGVVEPASAQPVRIADNVLIGANAVVLEGVQVGAGAVIAAGAVVIEDVPANTVVAGVPAKVIKTVNQDTRDKTALVDALRDL